MSYDLDEDSDRDEDTTPLRNVRAAVCMSKRLEDLMMSTFDENTMDAICAFQLGLCYFLFWLDCVSFVYEMYELAQVTGTAPLLYEDRLRFVCSPSIIRTLSYKCFSPDIEAVLPGAGFPDHSAPGWICLSLSFSEPSFCACVAGRDRKNPCRFQPGEFCKIN